jgi:hypothetical protein
MDAIVSAVATYKKLFKVSSSAKAFTVGEEVYAGSSASPHAIGRVDKVEDTADNNYYVTVNVTKGVFEVGDTLVGRTSNASTTITQITDTDTRTTNANIQDNEAIDLEANRDNIFDFTEKDPFSEGNY